MIRVYFVFSDPFDEDGVNLSYVDIPTGDPGHATARVESAARSGELWKALYPEDDEWPYELFENKMTYLDISKLPNEQAAETLLTL